MYFCHQNYFGNSSKMYEELLQHLVRCRCCSSPTWLETGNHGDNLHKVISYGLTKSTRSEKTFLQDFLMIASELLGNIEKTCHRYNMHSV